jgi:hypothetical protein
MAEPAPGISATPHEDNLRYFDVIISGPTQSPFEGKTRETVNLDEQDLNSDSDRTITNVLACTRYQEQLSHLGLTG